MKLTNYLRDAFINDVMNDVPEIDYMPLVQAALTKAARDKLPFEIKAIIDDPKFAQYLNTENVYTVCGTVYVPIPELDYKERDRWMDEIRTAPEVVELIKAYNAQQGKHIDLRMKLQNIAYGCTTLKALKQALPEFDKYMPAEDAPMARNLPVVANVVADFVKAGWPKDKQPEAQAA